MNRRAESRAVEQNAIPRSMRNTLWGIFNPAKAG